MLDGWSPWLKAEADTMLLRGKIQAAAQMAMPRRNAMSVS
jgi:hypothetical protein